MIAFIRRRWRAFQFNRELERNLAARRAARMGGRVYVAAHQRRK